MENKKLRSREFPGDVKALMCYPGNTFDKSNAVLQACKVYHVAQEVYLYEWTWDEGTGLSGKDARRLHVGNTGFVQANPGMHLVHNIRNGCLKKLMF